jgi:PTH1 family peptidyl-tRNA hydrolase
MRVIVGLGNPGKEYKNTRHNVGSFYVSSYADAHGAILQQKSKYNALVAEISQDGEKALLVIPTGYYNNSGVSVQSIANFYKITPEDVLIVHDELALPFGTIRTRFGGSDAGNNGVKSVTSHIGEATARIRVGVYNELRDKIDDADFVLSKFSQSEQSQLEAMTPTIHECIDEFIRGKLPHTTHTLAQAE